MFVPSTNNKHAMNKTEKAQARITKMDLMRRASYCPEARAELRAIYATQAKK